MKKLLILLLSVALIAGVLGGCADTGQSGLKDSGGNQYYFYYTNQEETKLQRESYVPEKESPQDMIDELEQKLNDRETSGDYQALFPKEVQIQSCVLDDTSLLVYFNSGYTSMGSTREILVRAGVVRSFLQVPGISGVKFYVGNTELTDSKGNPIGTMDNSSFVELWGDDRDAYRYDTFTLYFTDSTGEKLVEEERSVYYKRSLPRERVILEQLIKGPIEKGHYPTLPENTEVMSVTTSDRVCYVNFSQAFSDAALDIPEKTIIYSVVNSVLAAVDADKVQISLNGQDDVSFGENTSLYNFFGWNTDLIQDKE